MLYIHAEYKTMIINPIRFLFQAEKQWRLIGGLSDRALTAHLLYPLLFALGPCIAWYYGITDIGWSVGDGDTVKLTPDSARNIIIAFYFTMLGALAVVGYSIHWMAETYGAASSLIRGTVVASYAATPLFIGGLIGFLPIFWLDLLLGIVSLGWAVFVLYIGIPEVMKIPKERGFLYASAVICICMVILMAMMGGVVILWDMGITPVFTD